MSSPWQLNPFWKVQLANTSKDSVLAWINAANGRKSITLIWSLARVLHVDILGSLPFVCMCACVRGSHSDRVCGDRVWMVDDKTES